MIDAPQVSVVIPTYNRAELLRLTLRSVLAQTFPAKEIVVVDDGSTDDTASVVNEIAEEGSPILYLTGRHENRLGELRNRGVEATSGEWIAFLDSDDLWQPNRLDAQIKALERVPDAGLAFCNVQRFSESGPVGPGPYLPMSADYNGYILGDLLEEPVAVPSALMVRREVFEQVGGFADRPINEDYELTLLVAARYPASYVPDPLVLMRKHGDSRSRERNELALLEYISIVERFLAVNPRLPVSVSKRGRRGLANVHYKLVRLYLDTGDRAAARRHLREQVKYRPWDRRAVSAYLHAMIPFTTGVA
ncbi:MAG TPA: glycosyltransferase [Chloroflexia bacterium]|nr:glycosyltransferase [Chloroflexia bacterium]